MKIIDNTIFILLFSFFSSCSSNYSSNDLEVCKRIVEKIQAQELPLNSSVKFYIKDLNLKNGLKPLNPTLGRGLGRGIVHVYKTNESLNVFIETLDNGHAGEYGYAYSSTSDSIDWGDDIWGESWKFNGQINEYWWKIKYDQG